ncbi:hypothetical protein CRENBAI_017153 [Crenichthys baileyi]|uniref:Uncharacterized protein n=1 Tax=Crenichthys baileyi TaxID=28760 RepID=A0AAV9RY09_9TELE
MGQAEDMELEGEVNLILPFHHRPACSHSKMSWTPFQNPHLFGWEQGTGARRMQIEEAPLCTDGDPMPGTACGAERREGIEDRGLLVKGGVSLALSAITVSGGGWGTEKENQAVLVLPGSAGRRGFKSC